MVLSVLKKNYKCSLPHPREVAAKLSEYTETPWADLTLYRFEAQHAVPVRRARGINTGTVTAGMLRLTRASTIQRLVETRQLGVGGFGIVV